MISNLKESNKQDTMRCIRKMFTYICSSVRGDMKRWYSSEGQTFLKRIGVRPGYSVVDFGSKTGDYSIPAAMIVGQQGAVYAIDKNHKVLNKLQRKADSYSLTNIKIMPGSGDINIDLEDSRADLVMTYDVLHILEPDRRQALYREIKRVLHNDGVLSVNPKHTISDIPSRYFKNMTVDDVVDELEQAGFVFINNTLGTLSHNSSLAYGCVYNFGKKVRQNIDYGGYVSECINETKQ